MDIERLESMLKELFVENSATIEGNHLNPSNIGHLAVEIFAERSDVKTVEKVLRDSLVEVIEAVDRDKGITNETYEANRRAINSFARFWKDSEIDLTYTHGNLDLWKIDNAAREPTPEQAAKFPEEGVFGEAVGGVHTNIFDDGYKGSSWEGTLFQREYNDDGHLSFYRIYHQPHRNTLKIKTFDVGELIEGMRTYIRDFQEDPDSRDITDALCKFTLLEERAYLRRIQEFNVEFGDYVRLQVCGEGKEAQTIAILSENPKELAEKLAQYDQKGRINVNVSSGSLTYTVAIEKDVVDLMLERHWNDLDIEKPFDPEADRDSKTVIRPRLVSEASIKLICLYVSSQQTQDL